MKTITWASEDNALKRVLEDSSLYVISFDDPYSTGRATALLRKEVEEDKLLKICCTLDKLNNIDFDILAKFILSIPKDADLIVHCTEGRFRSKYLVEVIQGAYARYFDDFIKPAPCLGIKGEIHRDDIWTYIRPMMEKLETSFKNLESVDDPK